ncbi:unnamed protein product [Pleuronectes platessa]|uniref:Uncharacterized protein n=1 Tax=Pleuronectes platessa TaxID=8262 RepID=A0A9N7U672_PLEPL|nr:unnamed protein product [Pleuronectes platessa]
MSQKDRPAFYLQELNKTVWDVPVRYQNLSPVGSGAYGSVWRPSPATVGDDDSRMMSPSFCLRLRCAHDSQSRG